MIQQVEITRSLNRTFVTRFENIEPVLTIKTTMIKMYVMHILQPMQDSSCLHVAVILPTRRCHLAYTSARCRLHIYEKLKWNYWSY